MHLFNNNQLLFFLSFLRILNDGSVNIQTISYFEANTNEIPEKPTTIMLKANQFVVAFEQNQYGIYVEFNSGEKPICFPADIALARDRKLQLQTVNYIVYLGGLNCQK